METQEQKFTRELANSRMQIELLRNQVLLRYYAQLLELDIMQHPKEPPHLSSVTNFPEGIKIKKVVHRSKTHRK